MTRDDRMEDCVCANGAKVAEIVHPYCHAHVPPEMEAELASLRAEVERLKAELKQARKDRDREALDRQTAGDAWNDMRRQRDAALGARHVGVPRAALALVVDTLTCAINPDERRAVDEVRAWLASLPGGDKEPNRLCACGRRTSECDRSRKACISESR